MSRAHSTDSRDLRVLGFRPFCALLCGLAACSLLAIPLRAEDQLTPDQKIIHVLDRLGFGPRPGDVERVKQMGLGNYLQQQLHPERIDDSAVEEKLGAFPALSMTSTALMEALHEDQRLAAERKKAKAEAEKQSEIKGGSQSGDAEMRAENLRKFMDDKPGEHLSRIAVAQLQDAKIIRAVESNRQLYEVLVDFWSNHFNIDVRKGSCRVLKVIDDREAIRPHVFGKFRDLLEASAKSPAMLFYLDNAQNSAARELTPREELIRARLRARVPGALPDPIDTGKPRVVGAINENYAREIMELHTLGVDGGYSQKDVQEVARCFTGWGINLRTGAFEFHPRRHDEGQKIVLGHMIPAGGGANDVETVLDILARSPSTAKFISGELCQRLVADDPPAALVDRVAGVFRATDGDLRKVVEAIIYSPEFYSPAAYRAKIKSPFEFAVSAVRAAGGTMMPEDNVRPPLTMRLAMETGATFGRGMDRLANARRKTLDLSIIQLGQPLFAYQAPTGYPEDSRKWVNAGALIARMNFSLTLAEQNLVDVSLPIDNLVRGVDIDKPELVLNRLNDVLLQGRMSESTRATLEKQALGPRGGVATTVNVPQLVALMLGSPEFQRH
ncbi:MAG TPA: DUF1800 domain-containing protein [Verrucomicrobiae bacterium]|nr:DUF1800 domain-containing protein [Verrucomicrobiae bacterium]